MGTVCKKFINSSTDRRGPTSIPGSLSFTDVFRRKNHEVTSGTRTMLSQSTFSNVWVEFQSQRCGFLSGFLNSTLIYVLFRNQQCDLSEILNYFFHFDLLFTLKKTSSHPESRKELQNDGKNVVLKPNT